MSKRFLCLYTDSYWFYPSLLSLDLVSVLDATLDFLTATADDVGCFRDAGACILVRTAPVVYVDCLFITHYVILPRHSYIKCMHVENNQI